MLVLGHAQERQRRRGRWKSLETAAGAER